MNNAKNVGFKRALPFNLGMFTGFFVVMILCMIFSAVLYSIIPKIQFPMKIVGAAYWENIKYSNVVITVILCNIIFLISGQ
jgi:threonine/homoserine/homoserine lactone efflux protein